MRDGILLRAMDETFNGDKRGAERETGFVLLVFPFTHNGVKYEGRANYISNANRADIVVLLKEQLAYFQGQPDNLKGSS